MLPANIDSGSDLEDLFDGIDEMDEGQLRQLHEYLDNIPTEDGENYEDGNESMFSDLCLDAQPTPSTSTKDSYSSVFQSPIRHRTHRRPLTSSNEVDISLQVRLPALDQYEEMLRSCDVESHDLMNKATRSMSSAYALIAEIDNLENELPRLPRMSRSILEQPMEEPQQDQQENIPPSARTAATSVPATANSVNSQKVTKEEETQAVTILDKRLRQVLAPAPGKTLYRHDPVTAINLYKEEWKRKPTPEEQKRLSLRWKVRDLMMTRRFMPKNHPTGGPIDHPKDWSPRPYLD